MITSKTESITTKTTLAILIVTMALALDRVSLAGDFVVTDRPAARGFVVTDKWKPKEKPVVDFYSAPWCGVCVVPDKELARDSSSLPFRIRKVNVDATPLSPNLPAGEQTVPHFQWLDADGHPVYCKWKDREDLVARWTLSQKKTPKKPSFGSPGARWTWPGRLDDHLASSHGVDAQGMSQREMEDLHDSLHEGRVSR